MLTAIVVCLGVCVWPRDVPAQTGQSDRGRFEIAVGPVWIGRASFGTRAATETTVSGGRFELFSTTTELAAGSAVDATMSIGLTRSLDIVGGVSYGRAGLRTSISGDAEGASPVTASESLRRVTVEGGVRWYLPTWRLGSGIPFLSAAGGYLRDLHEGDTLVAAGHTLSAGGGMRFTLVAREGRLKAAGVRAEARVVARRGGAGPERFRTSPAVGASVFFRF